MIDWTKEIATKNYCGYCTVKKEYIDRRDDSNSCDGSCLSEKNKANRVDHILEMLKIIPEQIEKLKKKEQDYKDTLTIK